MNWSRDRGEASCDTQGCHFTPNGFQPPVLSRLYSLHTGSERYPNHDHSCNLVCQAASIEILNLSILQPLVTQSLVSLSSNPALHTPRTSLWAGKPTQRYLLCSYPRSEHGVPCCCKRCYGGCDMSQTVRLVMTRLLIRNVLVPFICISELSFSETKEVLDWDSERL